MNLARNFFRGIKCNDSQHSDEWFCVDFKYDLEDGEGEQNRSVWLNYAKDEAVLAADCANFPVESWISNSENCEDATGCQLKRGMIL